MGETNRRASSLVFLVENLLRELIICELSSRFGEKWYTSRLPQDVSANYKKGISYERGQLHTQFVPHHPLYYVDFPDLRKTIERRDNWREIFTGIFGPQATLVSELASVEPIRNKVAHSRVINGTELARLEVLFDRLIISIGEGRAKVLINQTTALHSIATKLAALRTELSAVAQAIASVEPIEEQPEWEAARDAWWFEADYIGVDLEPIIRCYSLIAEYKKHPRHRGAGISILKWLEEVNFNESAEEAKATIGLALGE